VTKLLGLRTVIYMVPDLLEAKNWYTKAFGVEPYFDEPYYVGFNIGGYELGLHPEQNPNKAENTITYWGVEDIQTAYDSLISIGAKADEAPNNVGGEIVVASVLDPWGDAIGLIYNPEFVAK
jgi:predicted enzyme related to lactoylglutathione lyase